jgi:hypothetical protein
MASLAGASTTLALVVSGCGGDDTSTGADAADAKQESTSDHTMMMDGKTDVIQSDASDAPSPEDVQDGGMPDVPSDVKFFDVGDAGFDVGDATINDAPFEVSITDFPTAVNTAYCQRLEACCSTDGGAGAGADAGGFVATCLASFGPYSASGNLNLANPSSPHVVYVPANAKECLAQLAATPCGTETAAQSELNYLTCASAIQGTLTPGTGPCTSSFDCVSGAYCASDGGLCTSLAKVNMPCKDTTYSQDCTYLGNGDPLLFCNADSGTCLDDLVNGSTCDEYQQCASQVCNFGSTSGTCATTFQYSYPALCAAP